MQIFAYCAQSYAESVRQATGIEPRTCPPTTVDTLEPRVLVGHNLIYFKLHGQERQHYWYGDDTGHPALSTFLLERCTLGGAIVFCACCHVGPSSPMLRALFVAGASAVIGAPGAHYARAHSLAGVDLVGRSFRLLLEMGLPPDRALALAAFRQTVRLRYTTDPDERRALIAALELQCYTAPEPPGPIPDTLKDALL
jgi:hypothetical protein